MKKHRTVSKRLEPIVRFVLAAVLRQEPARIKFVRLRPVLRVPVQRVQVALDRRVLRYRVPVEVDVPGVDFIKSHFGRNLRIKLVCCFDET
jgi:hypothetical protein